MTSASSIRHDSSIAGNPPKLINYFYLINKNNEVLFIKRTCYRVHKLKPGGVALSIEGDGVKCVFHTHVANQIPDQDKYELMTRIRKLGEARDVFHLYNNMWDPHLHLDYDLDGSEYRETLAETDGHGRWFRWKR
ncbi:DUF2332 family protein [Paenibacillus thermoaerophilus]|nr:DUF2332 family protein [Paenibacillus thermoaerophilus]